MPAASAPGTHWSALLLARPGWLAALCVVASVLAMHGMSRLEFTTDYRAFFSPDNPELEQLEFLETNFSRAETLIITVAPHGGEVFRPEVVDGLRFLTDAWPQLPYARGAVSLINFQEVYGDGEEIVVRPLLPEHEVDAREMAAIRARALADPRLLNVLLGPDAGVTGVIVYFELPHLESQKEIAEVAAASRALAQAFLDRHPDHDVHLTGVVMLNQTMSETLLGEGRTLYPLAFAVMTLLLLVLYRSLAATLGTLLVVIFSAGTAMGAAGWLGITLTSPSLTAGLVVMTLAVADCVHLLSTVGSRMAAGAAVRDALAESLRVNGRAIVLTSVTTAVGFLGMNFSDSPPFRDLGNMVAIGVIAAMVLSFAFLPWWVTRFPVRRPPVTDGLRRGMVKLAEGVTAHRRPLLLLGVVVVGSGLYGLSQNRFGDNYVEFFQHDNTFRVATEFTNERLTGMQYVEYAVAGAGAGGVFEPEYLQRLAEFVEWLRAQPEVIRVSSVIDLMRSLNQAMSGGDVDAYRLPDDRELAAQYMFFYEISLPAGVDLTHLANMDKSATRVSVQLTTITSEEIRLFDQRVQDWQARHWPQVMRAPGAGISIMFSHIARRNFQSMLIGTALAFAVIGLLMLLTFRDARLAAISLVPNLMPTVIGFGIWGVTVGQVGMSLAVVASLTLGIVVDDTIHLLNRYGRARRELGMNAADAVREAFASVGVALVVTTVVLLSGFLVFSASGFLLTAHLGALTAIVIAVALIADLLFLPPLLLWLDRDRSPR